jgi:hypothetical protein
MASFCEHCNKYLGSIKVTRYLIINLINVSKHHDVVELDR